MDSTAYGGTGNEITPLAATVRYKPNLMALRCELKGVSVRKKPEIEIARVVMKDPTAIRRGLVFNDFDGLDQEGGDEHHQEVFLSLFEELLLHLSTIQCCRKLITEAPCCFLVL